MLYLPLNFSNLLLVKIGYLPGRSGFLTEWGHFCVLKSSRCSGSSEEPLPGASDSALWIHKMHCEITKPSPSSKHCNSLTLIKSLNSSAWLRCSRRLYEGPAEEHNVVIHNYTGVQHPKGEGNHLLGHFTSDFHGTRDNVQLPFHLSSVDH